MQIRLLVCVLSIFNFWVAFSQQQDSIPNIDSSKINGADTIFLYNNQEEDDQFIQLPASVPKAGTQQPKDSSKTLQIRTKLEIQETEAIPVLKPQEISIDAQLDSTDLFLQQNRKADTIPTQTEIEIEVTQDSIQFTPPIPNIPAPPSTTELANAALQGMYDKLFLPNYLRLKGSLDIKSKALNQGSSAYFRFGSDTIMWVSIVPALGFEVARALVTPDSAFLVNKLQKVRYQYPNSVMKTEFGMDFTSAELIGIFLGRFEIPVSNVIHTQIQADWQSQFIRNGLDFTVRWNAKTGIHLIQAVSKTQNVRVDVTYSGKLQITENQHIPKKILLIAKQGNEINQLEVEYSSPDTKGTPIFELPVGANYEVRP